MTTAPRGDTLPIRIDATSSVAPFEQVRARILELIGSGELPPGSRLPTVRRLAEDLGIAANTVARSYRELERDGVIETRGRRGTFVAHDGDRAEREAMAAAEAYAARILRLGLSPSDGIRFVTQALRTAE